MQEHEYTEPHHGHYEEEFNSESLHTAPHEEPHHTDHRYGQAYEHEMHSDFGPDHMHLKPVVPHHKDERLKIPSEPAQEHHAIAAQK